MESLKVLLELRGRSKFIIFKSVVIEIWYNVVGEKAVFLEYIIFDISNEGSICFGDREFR